MTAEKKRRALIVYPENFQLRTDGRARRVFMIAEHLAAAGVEIDHLGCRGYSPCEAADDYTGAEETGLVSQVYVSAWTSKEARRSSLFSSMISHAFPSMSVLPNDATPSMRLMFKLITEHAQYDHIVIAGVEFTHLLHKVRAYGRRILLADTSLARECAAADRRKYPNYGRLLNEELYRMSVFDRVCFMSHDDKLSLGAMLPRGEKIYLPHFMPSDPVEPDGERDIDALFASSGGADDERGIRWFVSDVLPKINGSMHVAVHGRICGEIQDLADRVELLGAEGDAPYGRAKCAIVPIVSGTRMRRKTAAAMSRGVAVVSTEGGAAGLPDKTENGIAIASDAGRFAQILDRIVRDDSYRARRAELAARYHRRRLSTEAVKPQMDALFDLN